jgi:hypothetical protein
MADQFAAAQAKIKAQDSDTDALIATANAAIAAATTADERAEAQEIAGILNMLSMRVKHAAAELESAKERYAAAAPKTNPPPPPSAPKR